ncbi:Na+/H+ antiporter NhaA [Thiotrichales bacterium 19S3-7]|nr:Na+/H+ antiporter NhaA [Thiotrichales bacterium 19S3-7]MCF6800771.1 Na+/H+ antiporter NhaA [Thiotrichales bacterium 19S3-11]
MEKSIISKLVNKTVLPSVILLLMAILAMVIANSPLNEIYNKLISSTIALTVNDYGIKKPILLWINDGFMAIFFLLIGIELKKEFLGGVFQEKKQIILPLMGALGGIIFPVLIYFFFNYHDEYAIRGWAIPAATDIAFAVGLLALFGSRLNKEIRVLLTSIAIFDDLAAIIIIAVFYTPNISVSALLFVALCIIILFILNRLNITGLTIYWVIGMIMWFAMIKSGVHATLTGFILAFFIPYKSNKSSEFSPLINLEHKLTLPVAYFILPIFAFANSGVNFSNLGFEGIFHYVPLGIALGLFIGKQIGVFLFCFLAIRLRMAYLPKNMTWLNLYGLSILTGIGFTMSLFIGSLAFDRSGLTMLFDERVGILIGSLLSAIFGYIVLKFSLKKRA